MGVEAKALTAGEASKLLMDFSQQLMRNLPQGVTLIASVSVQVDTGEIATANIIDGKPVLMLEQVVGLAEKIDNHIKTELSKKEQRNGH